MNYHSLKIAADVVKQGGVVAYPTEHCYGLGCDPENITGIKRILAMKKRRRAKGLILVSDRIYRLNHYIRYLPENLREEILQSWPGPFTWLIPARGDVSSWLRGQHTSIALRVTAHSETRTLCRLARTALVSTSANRSGRAMLTSAIKVEQEFRNEVDYVVKGRVGKASAPSTIRDGISGIVIRG